MKDVFIIYISENNSYLGIGVKLQEYFETAMVVVGLVVVLSIAGFLWSLSPKILGFIMLLLSLFVFRYYPRMTKYQPVQFQRAGVLTGLLLLVAGIILIVFF